MNDSKNSTEAAERLERIEIDSSCKVGVLFFYTTAIFWLLLGTVLGLIASMKLHHPGFLSDVAWLTYGRIQPVHTKIMTLGWASSAAFGTGIWLMARLSRSCLKCSTTLLTAAVLWNLGVLLGVGAILAGEGTSIEGFEFPSYANFFLLLAFVFIGVQVILMFYDRKKGDTYVSQWYLLAAFFWFPWLYGTAQIMLLCHPVQGVLQEIVSGWFADTLIGLWFTSIGLATIYYMIPTVIGKPIRGYHLSIFGFLAFAFFYSWGGARHLIGGPFPVWIQSASIVASVMTIMPVTIIAMNHHMTLFGNFSALKASPTLRFIAFGAISYTLVSLEGILTSFRKIHYFTHFTYETMAHSHWALYAFFTMVMFGAMYYIIPRLVSWEWPSVSLIRTHFWSVAIGTILMIFSLMIAGFLQGVDLQDPKVPFMSSLQHTLPYMQLSSFSGLLIAIGHISFAILFLLIIFHSGMSHLKPAVSAKTSKEISDLVKS